MRHWTFKFPSSGGLNLKLHTEIFGVCALWDNVLIYQSLVLAYFSSLFGCISSFKYLYMSPITVREREDIAFFFIVEIRQKSFSFLKQSEHSCPCSVLLYLNSRTRGVGFFIFRFMCCAHTREQVKKGRWLTGSLVGSTKLFSSSWHPVRCFITSYMKVSACV